MKGSLFALAFVGLLQACGGGEADSPASGDRAAALANRSQMELWKLELMKEDHAFNNAVRFDGPSRWSTFFAPDGSVIQAGVGEIEGQEAIQDSFNEAIYSGALASLQWFPERAEVSQSGDLGYTVGQYRSEGVDSARVRTVFVGKYVNIWRRQADGTWKVEMDLGIPVTEPQVISPPVSGGGS
jgi:ketosteroid isomerase-like protein